MYIGLDVGATKIGVGLVTRGGKIVEKNIFKTQTTRSKKAILNNILKAAESVWTPKVKAAGIGMAGRCDFKNGIFLSGSNFPKNLKNINLRKIFRNKFKIPASLDNDAHCFALAESVYGAGKNYKDIVGVTLGTGIGGGIVINKKIYRGKNNTAGELGHMTIGVSSLFRCSCGKIDHFEALASGRAMSEIYKTFTGQSLDTFKIEKLATKGDKKAKQTIALMAKYLGLGLTNIIHILNPEIIIVGGGLIRVKSLWQPALQEAKENVLYNSLKTTKIVKSKLGNNAGILGAALLCRS